MRGKLNQCGFTLMEVLVALTILSMSLLVAIKVASETSLSAIKLRDKTYAQWVALNKVAELRLQTTWPPIGKTDGNMEMAGQSWHWTTEITTTPNQFIHKLDVSVRLASETSDAPATEVVSAFLRQP